MLIASSSPRRIHVMIFPTRTRRSAATSRGVGIIGTLYAIEERAKGLDANARGELRRAEGRSASILIALKEKLFAWRDQLLPKHPMAQAIQYALNQWSTLTAFVGEGAGGVPIDNNAAEREMKRIVLNRKNSLFVGNERDPLQPHQHLPPSRHRPAALPDATAHQPPGHAAERAGPLAAR